MATFNFHFKKLVLNFSSKANHVILHVCAWFILLYLPVYVEEGIEEFIQYPFLLLEIIIDFLPLLFLFYFNANFLVPRYFSQRKFLMYGVRLLLLCSVLLTYAICIDYYHFEAEFEEEPWRWGISFIDHLFFLLFILASSLTYKLLWLWWKNEKLKNESELKLLKSQINPHFLFNSLNTLYSLMNANESKKAEQAILKLSDLLRYTIYESHTKKVELSSEIEYIKNYIELQKLRLPKNVTIDFQTSGDFEQIVIEPMLIIPFVENAFKHGVSYQQPSEITITLKCVKDMFSFSIQNTINQNRKEEQEAYSGIGISNVKERLALLYPTQHQLIIDKGKDVFTVELTLLHLK